MSKRTAPFGILGAIAMAAMASPAHAVEGGEGAAQEAVAITAFAPPTCGISADAPSQTLSVDLIDATGHVDGGAVQAAIVTALNDAGVFGFCTGANNTVAVSRTPFVLGGDGSLQNNFARAVLYDVQVSVSNDDATFTDTTADGPAGASAAGRFGPSGPGAAFTFANASGGGALPLPIAVVTSSPDDDGPSASFTNRPTARLVAGTYVSTVTIKLTPGL